MLISKPEQSKSGISSIIAPAHNPILRHEKQAVSKGQMGSNLPFRGHVRGL